MIEMILQRHIIPESPREKFYFVGAAYFDNICNGCSNPMKILAVMGFG
jgi:hypothetical protein